MTPVQCTMAPKRWVLYLVPVEPLRPVLQSNLEFPREVLVRLRLSLWNLWYIWFSTFQPKPTILGVWRTSKQSQQCRQLRPVRGHSHPQASPSYKTWSAINLQNAQENSEQKCFFGKTFTIVFWPAVGFWETRHSVLAFALLALLPFFLLFLRFFRLFGLFSHLLPPQVTLREPKSWNVASFEPIAFKTLKHQELNQHFSVCIQSKQTHATGVSTADPTCRVPPFDPVGLGLFGLGFCILGLGLCFRLGLGLGLDCLGLGFYSLLFLHLYCALGFGLVKFGIQRTLQAECTKPWLQSWRLSLSLLPSTPFSLWRPGKQLRCDFWARLSLKDLRCRCHQWQLALPWKICRPSFLA